jgi:HSP20 family protein
MEIIEIHFGKGLLDIHRQMERIMDDIFSRTRPLFIESEMRKWGPPTDVFETTEGVIILSEIPGVDREDIDIYLEGDLIKISGVRRNPISQPKRMHQMEIEFGHFERYVRIPIPIDLDGIQATYKDGLLKVFLPKKIVKRIEKVEVIKDI